MPVKCTVGRLNTKLATTIDGLIVNQVSRCRSAFHFSILSLPDFFADLPTKQPQKDIFADRRMDFVFKFAEKYHDQFIDAFVSLALSLLKYQTELAWKDPTQINHAGFIDRLETSLRVKIYNRLRDDLVKSDINLFSLEVHYPRIARLLPEGKWPVSARHVTPRLLNPDELSAYQRVIGRIDSPSILVDQLLVDYATRCETLSKSALFCLNQSNGLCNCFSIGQLYFSLIQPVVGKCTVKLPICSSTALLSNVYQSRHLYPDLQSNPFWTFTQKNLTDDLVILTDSLQDKDVSQIVCNHLCKILRISWDFQRFFNANDVTSRLDDVISKLVSQFGSKRHFREACSLHFSDMMRQLYHI